MNHKKGFVLYLDNLHIIRALPDPQLGLLFRALADYATAAAEGSFEETVTPTDFLSHFPDMEPAVLMAYSFISDTICRDTLKWKAKQQNYSAAARERERERRSREEVLAELRNPQQKDWRC